MNICIYGASSNKIDQSFISAGEQLGREMVARGHSLVFGGGANGLMGAAARGVHESGGRIIGVSPKFFNVDGILYEHCDELIYTDTMRERKQIMEDRADAFIMTAGGIGTFEEFFEILTLKQLERHQKPIAVLNTNGYYDPLVAMLEKAANDGFMTGTCMKLFFVSDDTQELLTYIENYKAPHQSINKLKNI